MVPASKSTFPILSTAVWEYAIVHTVEIISKCLIILLTEIIIPLLCYYFWIEKIAKNESLRQAAPDETISPHIFVILMHIILIMLFFLQLIQIF